MKYTLIIILFLFHTNLNAQTEHGYLLRCYNNGGTKDSNNYFLFSMFIESNDFKNQEFDSFLIDQRHNMSFAEQLVDFFHHKPYYIYLVVNKRHIEDKSCVVSKPISLGDISRQMSLEIVLKIHKDYYYKIYIDKVDLDFCKMMRISDFEKSFKEVIALKKAPYFFNLSDWEKEKLLATFAKVKGVSYF